jgi:hypothetical protein
MNVKYEKGKQKFELGIIVSTPGAIKALAEVRDYAEVYLDLHSSGDWGDVSESDKKENELSLKKGFRIISAYKLPITGKKIWIITEANRSMTTILLPSEY